MDEKTSRSVELADKLLSNPILFPDKFKNWIVDRFAVTPPLLPYSQVLRARLNQAKSSESISAAESTGSSAYVDLATRGPEFAGLVDGEFLFLFGMNASGALPMASLNVNDTTPSDDDALAGTGANGTVAANAMRGCIKTIKNDNVNSVRMQYKTIGGGSPSISQRWMLAFRIGPA